MKSVYIIIALFLIPGWAIAQEDRIMETEVQLESQFLDAYQLQILEKWDEALTAFLELELINQNEDVIKFEIAKLYEQKKDNPNAITYLKKAIQLRPDRKIYQEYLIDLLIREKDYVSLNEELKALIDNGNQTVDYHIQLARSFEQIGNNKEALKVLKKLEKNSGYSEKIGNARVRIYQKERKHKKLEAELNKLTEAYPGKVNILLHKAILLHSMNKEEKALETYREILYYQPDHRQANIYVSSYNKGTNAQNDFLTTQMSVIENENIPLDDKIKQLIPFVSELDFGSDLTKDMLIIMDDLQRRYPNEATVNALHGDVFFNSANLQKAAEYYEKTLQLNKSNFMVWKHLMLSLDNTMQFEKLSKISQEAIDYYPNQAICYYYAGKANIENKAYKKGINWLEEGIWLCGNNRKLKSEFYLEITFANLLLNNADQARKAFNKVEINTLGPDHGFYFEVLGDIMKLEKKDKEAIENWKKSLRSGGRKDRLEKKLME